MIQFYRAPGFERFDFRRIPLHRFLIRIYELVRRYGLYVGVLPSLIALILPEKYFYISIPLLLFAILLDSLSFYYGRIPEELVEKRRKIAKATVYGVCTTIALLAACVLAAFLLHPGNFWEIASVPLEERKIEFLRLAMESK